MNRIISLLVLVNAIIFSSSGGNINLYGMNISMWEKFPADYTRIDFSAKQPFDLDFYCNVFNPIRNSYCTDTAHTFYLIGGYEGIDGDYNSIVKTYYIFYEVRSETTQSVYVAAFTDLKQQYPPTLKIYETNDRFIFKPGHIQHLNTIWEGVEHGYKIGCKSFFTMQNGVITTTRCDIGCEYDYTLLSFYKLDSIFTWISDFPTNDREMSDLLTEYRGVPVHLPGPNIVQNYKYTNVNEPTNDTLYNYYGVILPILDSIPVNTTELEHKYEDYEFINHKAIILPPKLVCKHLWFMQSTHLERPAIRKAMFYPSRFSAIGVFKNNEKYYLLCTRFGAYEGEYYIISLNATSYYPPMLAIYYINEIPGIQYTVTDRNRLGRVVEINDFKSTYTFRLDSMITYEKH